MSGLLRRFRRIRTVAACTIGVLAVLGGVTAGAHPARPSLDAGALAEAVLAGNPASLTLPTILLV